MQDHGVLEAMLSGVWARITWLHPKWVFVELAIECVMPYDFKETASWAWGQLYNSVVEVLSGSDMCMYMHMHFSCMCLWAFAYIHKCESAVMREVFNLMSVAFQF